MLGSNGHRREYNKFLYYNGGNELLFSALQSSASILKRGEPCVPISPCELTQNALENNVKKNSDEMEFKEKYNIYYKESLTTTENDKGELIHSKKKIVKKWAKGTNLDDAFFEDRESSDSDNDSSSWDSVTSSSDSDSFSSASDSFSSYSSSDSDSEVVLLVNSLLSS